MDKTNLKQPNSNEDMYTILKRRKYIKDNYTFLYKNLFLSLSIQDYWKESIIQHSKYVYSFSIFQKEVLMKIKEEALNFSNSLLPIVSPNPSSLINETESCIFNEFAKEEISHLVSLIIPPLKSLFPHIEEIDDTDYLAFFNKFSDNNHSQLHSDESHITVSICLNEGFEGGEFVFNNGETIVKQTPFYAIAFLGEMAHFTNNTKGVRYNMIIYLRQKDIKLNNFYDKEYIDYVSYIGIRNVNYERVKKSLAFCVPELPRLKVIKSLK